MTAPALRPFLPADAPVLAQIFRASIEELAADDYDAAQIDAWAAAADDEDAFAARLGAGLTLVATLGGAAAGFASLAGRDTVDLVYVAPGAARQGVGSALLNALEKLAAARGATKLTADVSDTAQPFFAARGFTAQRRNTAILGDEFLGTTTMTKQLAPASERAT